MFGHSGDGRDMRMTVWQLEYADLERTGTWDKHLSDCNYLESVYPHFPPPTQATCNCIAKVGVESSDLFARSNFIQST
jgi:hypothetical protein